MDVRTSLIPFETFAYAPNSYEVTRELYLDYVEALIRDGQAEELSEEDDFFSDFDDFDEEYEEESEVEKEEKESSEDP